MKFRIYRNAEACFSGKDLEQTDLHYTDAWFEKLRAHGFTGFWLNVWMRRLVAFREPETDEQRQRQDILKRLMERAARFNMGVYLFLNEPKAFPRIHRIWQRFPNMRGAPGTWPSPKPLLDMFLLCTSSAEGKAYVYEMAHRLHTVLPGLAGTIHINASEAPTHCYCHTITNPGGKVFSSNQEHMGIDCPRCAQRTPGEVIAEILNLFHQGTRDAGSHTPVIAWNWNWIMYAPHPQTDLIKRLNPDITVMADFECGGMAPIVGRERIVNEYSLIYVGPSERYSAITSCAGEYGHRCCAKLQLGTTHEMATAANMPLVGNIYDKLACLRRADCDGIFGTWNFGNRFTLNTAAVGLFFKQSATPAKNVFLADLARDYLGLSDGRAFFKAVELIEDAFRHYPLCNQLIYFGPINFALALPLDAAPLAGKPLTVSCCNVERGDKWEDSLGPFTLDEVIGALDTMAVRLQKGLAAWEDALFPTRSPWATCLKDYKGPPVIPRHADRLTDLEMAKNMQRLLPGDALRDLPELAGIHGLRRLQEWCNGWFMLACVESAARVYKNYRAKRAPRPDYATYLKDLQAAERQTLEDCLPLLYLDARLGLHMECQQYFVTAKQVERKLAALS